MAHLSEREVFAKTVYAEARGEPTEGQRWVTWVIKNRANRNRSYWGGFSIKNVCLHPGQFECWNGRNDIPITEPQAYANICRLIDEVTNASQDPTDGADHYHNPSEGHRNWIDRCDEVRRIGNHIFYRTQQQYR